jgi:FAD-dependent oxidoreductase domain-containing protein 1
VDSDILIVGGGIIGCATAYFLGASGRAGRVVVVESDPTYARATTPQGAGGVRQLFSLPEHVRMSRYSLDFYSRFAETMAVDGEPAQIGFRREGYLFVVGAQGAGQLQANYEVQRAQGARVELLDRAALQRRFPSIGTQDVALACHSPDDGWIDPYAALMGLRRKAASLGVSFVSGQVTGFEAAGGLVRRAVLADGTRLGAARFLNAAGPWAKEVSAMVGMSLPVEPLCRVQHFWQVRDAIEPLPLVKDESGLFFRPEGDGYVGGRPSADVAPGFVWDVDRGYFADYFERTVWPLLANRLPKFEALRLKRTWGGHYPQTQLDGNMVLGPWTGGAANFHVAAGFSGHGIMHAPAAGHAAAEMLLDGRMASWDLERLSYRRIVENDPYPELGIR